MLSDRLKQALKDSGLTQAELARACGVKPPSVNGWLNGKSKFLRGENLLSAASALKVNQEWLATGKGPMKGQATDLAITYQSGETTVVEVKEREPQLSSDEQSLIDFYRKLGKEGRTLILSMVSESAKAIPAKQPEGEIRRTKLKIPHDKPGEQKLADPIRPVDSVEKHHKQKA